MSEVGPAARVLLLTQLLPYPLDSGAKVRQYYVLRHLAQRREVTLVCFRRDTDRAESVDHLRQFCRTIVTVPMRRTRTLEGKALLRCFASGQPFTIVRDERPEMYAQLERLEGPFAVIHADQLSMAPYALHAARALANGSDSPPRLVLDAHNAYYLIPERMSQTATSPAKKWFLRREAALMARYEAETYRRFDHVVTVTDEDRAALEGQFHRFGLPKPPFTTIPICINAGATAMERRPDPHGLLLLGGLHWPPNADAARWLVRHVWPTVRAKVPGARLFIVGARPPEELLALGDFRGIRHPHQAGDAPIVVTGYVDDPAPFIECSAALLAPLRSGGGMRVKIIEAMNWGLPVISTAIGCEGIQALPGHDLLVADEPAAFAAACVDLLTTPSLAARLSANGRQLVRREYHWRDMYSQFDVVYGLPSKSRDMSSRLTATKPPCLV